ncbi:uncharacterized protein ARMOST_07013 [Armillaria ostoyae]|uniref:Uncharacterized protein n=1 Tax=Armillaria ostoyae TaxID=47428 RepID=A0A284R4M0_ARMOS|nr:uncharacterized protein ARMOST_07013 [Armillaria ostoyae]
MSTLLPGLKKVGNRICNLLIVNINTLYPSTMTIDIALFPSLVSITLDAIQSKVTVLRDALKMIPVITSLQFCQIVYRVDGLYKEETEAAWRDIGRILSDEHLQSLKHVWTITYLLSVLPWDHVQSLKDLIMASICQASRSLRLRVIGVHHHPFKLIGGGNIVEM